MNIYSKALATIVESDADEFGPNGGFRAVLSTPSIDRDGERLHRDEWLDFTQKRYPLDIDHGMSVADTVGSFEPYWEGDKLMMKANFAGTPKAQEVRSLCTPDEAGIRHIGAVSVAFLTDKSQKDGAPRRELLNAGIVAIPSNRDAVILASKAASALKDAFSGEDAPEMPADVKEAVEGVLGLKDHPEPYGDVRYADPEDGKYPIDTVAHIRAALSYINVQHNYDALGDHAAHVKRAIEAAARAHGIHVSGDDSKSAGTIYIDVDVVPRLKDLPTGTILDGLIDVKAAGSSGSLVQAIHDASCHLGAACAVVETTDEGDGATSGANKGAEGAEVKDIYSGEGIDPAVHECPPGQADDHTKHKVRAIDAVLDEAEALTCQVDRSILPEPVAQALDLLTSAKITTGVLMKHLGIYDPDCPKSVDKQEAFAKALDAVLESDVDAPAEAAAATDEVPAPAVEAAADTQAKRARGMSIMSMIANLPK